MNKIDNKLDKAWSVLVKLRAGGYCEYCGSTRALNSHHIFTRAKRSVRWDLNNGICLCAGHHIGNKFSAHKTPVPFSVWIISKRGADWYNLLNAKSNQVSKLHTFEKEIILKELNDKIKQYELP